MSIKFLIRGEYIQLDQLLKAVGIVSSGGEAHTQIDASAVKVDGKIETRKRAKLRPGQRVTVGETEVVLGTKV